MAPMRLWFDPPVVRRAAERLHASASAQARSPELYLRLGAPDTVEGRFELLTLHVILLIERLKGAPGGAAAVRQTLFDVYVSHLDGALREMGVGDLAVGKRMRQLGEAFYGRASAFDQAFQSLPDTGPLEALLERTLFADRSANSPDAMADYVQRCRAALAEGDTAALVAGEASWPIP
jgi:cytochrome b pre-mRNA-processing protein 3